MNDFEVAIPSHHRAERLMSATYPLLTGRGIRPEQITVFLPDERQVRAYREAGLPDTVKVCSGHGLGAAAARNAIGEAYPVGTRLLSVDDDLTDIIVATSRTEKRSVDDLAGMVNGCFDTADGHLWCLYPVANPYFMRADARRGGLWFAIATFLGYTVRGIDHVERVTLPAKDDYERSCRFYLHDGEVVRYDRYAAVTRYAAEPGGMQDVRTEDTQRVGAKRLAEMFPDLAHPYQRKDGRWEIRLRDKAKGR